MDEHASDEEKRCESTEHPEQRRHQTWIAHENGYTACDRKSLAQAVWTQLDALWATPPGVNPKATNGPVAKPPAMELRVIENTDTELTIEIAGEDHTFMNVLKGVLLETDGVTAATYDMNPEQSGGQTEPVLSITTDGTPPLEALGDGAATVQTQTDELRDELLAAA